MRTPESENPLTFQNDHTILAEVDNPRYAYARDHLMRFADLVETSDQVHMYRLTPLSIWNACAAGVSPAHIVAALRAYLKGPLPKHITADIEQHASRYGRIVLSQDKAALILKADDTHLAEAIWRSKATRSRLTERLSVNSFHANPGERGELKQALVSIGLPAQDRAGITKGGKLHFDLRRKPARGSALDLRPYQAAAVERFQQAGSGIVILPHGSGKTIVGIGCMHQVQAATLILTSTPYAAQQWQAELLDKTTLTRNRIGIYSKTQTKLRGVTIASYETLTQRPSKSKEYPHLAVFSQRKWGLIILDEIQAIPKPVLLALAPLQSCRRLGLGATTQVDRPKEQAAAFALIGPKIANLPWRVLENEGWMPQVLCQEIRVPLPVALRVPYATSQGRSKLRLASENPDKLSILQEILAESAPKPVLILDSYVAHARHIAEKLGLPLVGGPAPPGTRTALFEDLVAGDLPALVISKVADHASEIPPACTVIQISGDYGARPVEAQHLCRILGQSATSHYFALVSHDTVEEELARKRQRLLLEQGFKYRIAEHQA